MRTPKYILAVCCMLVSTLAMAQITRISGTVSDDFDVLPGVNVVEIDASNRMVNATVTDMNGNFVLPVKSPKNKVKFSYMGYKTQTLPINKNVFKIKMEDNTKQMKDVVVTAKKKLKSSGLDIPEREVSFSTQGISAKEFEGLGITSVDEALQGRIAGLDIISNSGDLGSGSTMRLRGMSSLSEFANKQPKIVINGNIDPNIDMSEVDLNNANEETFATLLNVNVDDIEDIQVLKDAAATAMWGSDGANGIIEIRTKRGRRGPANVTYSLRMTATYQPAGIKMLNGDQYTMMLKEAYFNPKQNPNAANVDELSYNENFSEYNMYNKNTDWVDLVRQVGLKQSHAVNITGGDDHTQFRIAAGYDHQTGTIIKSSLDRLTTRMALDYKVDNRIKIISNFALTYTKNNQQFGRQLLNVAYVKMPNMSPYAYDRDGNVTGYYNMLESANAVFDKNQKSYINPVAKANLAKQSSTNYDIVPDLELEYKLLGVDDSQTMLNYNGRVVFNVSNFYTNYDEPRSLSTGSYLNAHATDNSSRKNFALTTTHSLKFQPKFKNEDHFLMSLARFQLVTNNTSYQSNAVNRLPNGITTTTGGGRVTSMTSSFGEGRKLSYAWQNHYSYKGRYILGFTLGLEARTEFGPSNRWAFSPGVSARWNIIDEPFMKWAREKLSMSMLSVAPSWGRTGNPPSQNFLYMNTYSTGLDYLGVRSMNMDYIKMTEMKWERHDDYNLGMELGFFDDRLKFKMELYQKYTYDMMLPYPLSSVNGYNELKVHNNGDLTNKGWEFYINGDRLLKKGKFFMDVFVNFSNNVNKITKIDPLILETWNTDFNESNNQILQRIQVGHPGGSIYGFRSKGVYQYNYNTAVEMAKGNKTITTNGQTYSSLQDAIDAGITFPVALNADGKVVMNDRGEPVQMRFGYKSTNTTAAYKFKGGDAIYEDVNHDGNINQYDIVYLGSSLPKLDGGFGFTFHYDRWSLSTSFRYRLDYDVINRGRLNREAMITNDNQSQAVNHRWRKEGDLTSIPRAMYGGQGANYNTLMSDRFVEDGSFLRLNYVRLSYSFDSKKLKKFHMNKLSFYVSANNLFLLTKYSGVDPEMGYWGRASLTVDENPTPRSKEWTLGVTVGF